MNDALFLPMWFSSPGETLLSLIASRGLTAPQLTERLNKPPNDLIAVIQGHRVIDDDLADDLGRSLRPSAAFWKARQRDFEDDLERVVDACRADGAEGWLALLPIDEMIRNGLLEPHEDDLIRPCLVFFDVASPDEWARRYTTVGTMLKTSTSFNSKPDELALWLRQIERRASLRTCGQWNADGLRSAVPNLRRLIKGRDPNMFVPKAQEILACHGVALELVPAPSGCTASGTARFVGYERAVIGLSLRHRTNDYFWFTLFHEIGHLLLHNPDEAWVDDRMDGGGPREDKANTFAFDVLVPRDYQDAFSCIKGTHREVMHFASSIGIHPGIVVGQLQHISRLPYSHLRALKRPVDWKILEEAVVVP